MARMSRIKVNGRGAYYHVMNRLSGPEVGYWPFTDVDKEKGFAIVEEACRYFLIEPISLTWMGNHFHLIVYVPSEDELPSDGDIEVRYNENRGQRRGLLGLRGNEDEPERLAKVKAEMRDLSCFTGWIGQVYTRYFNRLKGYRGRIWSDRFKSVLLEGESALWSCVKYVELNPVRANLVADCAEYRFCSWGRYKGSGVHPFASYFIKHMKWTKWVGCAGEYSDQQLYDEFEGELLRTVLLERQQDLGLEEEEIELEVKAVKRGERRESMPLRFLRRTRHWTDGAIIGSKAFVQETGCLFRERESVLRKKLSRGCDVSAGSRVAVYCFRRLQLL